VLTAEKKMKNNGSKDPWIYSCCTLCNTKSRERAQGLVSFVDYIHKKFNWKLGDCLVCAGCIAPLAWLPRLTLAR
jgi:hypothetical protein